MTTITLTLSLSGDVAFGNFVRAHGKPGLNLPAVRREVIDTMEDRLAAGEDLVYELRSQYTLSGRPACLTLTRDDLLEL